MAEICVLCSKSLHDGQAIVKLTAKGIVGINNASNEREVHISVEEGQFVHTKCRLSFTNAKSIAADRKRKAQDEGGASSSSKRSLRSSEPEFQFLTHCLFCGRIRKLDSKTKKWDVVAVRTEKQFQNAIKEKCRGRKFDPWAQTVLSRIEYAGDLCAADAVYHVTCNSNFRSLKPPPTDVKESEDEPSSGIPSSAGRPRDKVKADAFKKVLDYLESSDDEQLSVRDLVTLMESYLLYSESSAYSKRYMKSKLCEHYRPQIVIAELNGKPDVITFKHTASSILHDFYSSPKLDDIASEKHRIITAAADLIKSDIKELLLDTNVYPEASDISSIETNLAYLPDSLKEFLDRIFSGSKTELKVASIGQAIMQAARPRSMIAPIQLGLGVQLYHHFASRFLIETLYHHGLCSSYGEVKRFQENAAASRGTNLRAVQPGSFIQFIGDNVDHNTRTLDGLHTFHGMGVIAAVAPATQDKQVIIRASPSLTDIIATGKIPIQFYEKTLNMSSQVFTDYHPGNLSLYDLTEDMDFLWQISRPLKMSIPSWSGVIQGTLQSTHPGKAAITFLPLIDMNPSDPTCIYSTLMFVCQQANQYGITPVITFDQPLWWKAQMIVSCAASDSPLRQVVLKLGPFHTQMSYISCIGHIMAGTGLQEALETVYAPNTVVQMLNGKAVARAVRDHFLVDCVLHKLLISQAFHLPPREDVFHASEQVTTESPSSLHETTTECAASNESAQPTSTSDDESLQPSTSLSPEAHQEELNPQVSKESHPTTSLRKAVDLMESILSKNADIQELSSLSVIANVKTKLQVYCTSLKDQRTCELWLQYSEMVKILRKFIKAERTGNFRLHLECIASMLPYLAASGHNNYTKLAKLYLQQMRALEIQNPTVFQSLEDGHHVIRRTDRFWAGLSTDLVIEQVLMRSIKTSGGLTRGKGFGEAQQTVWTLSLPSCADVNLAMQTLCGISFKTSEQHVEMSQARLQRDNKDMKTLVDFFVERNPFKEDASLRNIASGEEAKSSVTADKAKEIGVRILHSMDGKKVRDITFSRKQQIVTMDAKSLVKIEGEKVHVDQKLLFQRLLTMAEKVFCNDQSVFKYELCSYPPTLFDSSGFPLEANKASLADYIWGEMTKVSPALPDITPDSQYVLDGGALLHRIVWPRGITYSEVLNMYVDYVRRKYGPAIVVFDGYSSGPTTKDMTHLRRKPSTVSTNVDFEVGMLVPNKKEAFLGNLHNKQRFIHCLSRTLTTSGCDVRHADADADLLIVQTGIEASRTRPTVIVGDDTDLLVLLLHHASDTVYPMFFAPEPKSANIGTRKIWDINETRLFLGETQSRNLLFCHAFSGCDTTSRIHGIGKRALVKKLTDKDFLELVESFQACSCSERNSVVKAGEKVMMSLFSTKPCSCPSLDYLRYQRFIEKTAVSIAYVQSNTLPPTAAATEYHSLRAYLQIQQWKGVQDLDPKDWGWELRKGYYRPVYTSLPAAPEELLSTIRCTCKTDCVSARCSCRKNGLNCSPACRECKGTSCLNTSSAHEDATNDGNDTSDTDEY